MASNTTVHHSTPDLDLDEEAPPTPAARQAPTPKRRFDYDDSEVPADGQSVIVTARHAHVSRS